jgi:hypothetical protein
VKTTPTSSPSFRLGNPHQAPGRGVNLSLPNLGRAAHPASTAATTKGSTQRANSATSRRWWPAMTSALRRIEPAHLVGFVLGMVPLVVMLHTIHTDPCRHTDVPCRIR